MLRNTLAADAAHVILDVRPDGSVEFMTRSTTGGATAYLAGAVQSFPAWLMLARTGTMVTGSISTDGGNTWTTVGSVAATGISSTAQIGLVVTSHDTSMLDHADVQQRGRDRAGERRRPASRHRRIRRRVPPASRPTDLTWSASGATSYDVRFGTASSPPLVSSGQSGATYTPGGLDGWHRLLLADRGAKRGRHDERRRLVLYDDDHDWRTRQRGDLRERYSCERPPRGVERRHHPTSPNGAKLVTPDNGVAQTTSALASPTDFVDVTFTAQAGTPYTLWMRLQASANSKWNDSIWVQFSDASVSGSSVYPLNTTNALLVNLATDGTGSSLSGWGSINSAYWLSQPTTVTFAASGTHTLRVQVREDGIQFDQIVLSPTTYLNAPPGPTANDSTIVPKP